MNYRYNRLKKEEPFSTEGFKAFEDRDPEERRRGQDKPELSDHIAELGLLKFESCVEHKIMGKIKEGDRCQLARLHLEDIKGKTYITGASIVPASYKTTNGRTHVSIIIGNGQEIQLKTSTYGEEWYLLPKDFNTSYLG